MPIVHHSDSRFTGREVVAGLILDFTGGSANVPTVNAAAEAVLSAVKGWQVTEDVPTPSAPPRMPKLPRRPAADTADDDGDDAA